VIAISSRPAKRTWNTVSFASTLYLIPILDLLISEIPYQWRAEVRLGLQEALVNAAKHGNKLDPAKTVLVRFTAIANQYRWVISDQGTGFTPPKTCTVTTHDQSLPCDHQECGRGLYILYQIFDHVEWNAEGTELHLCKQLKPSLRLPLLS
jgi:anti-sigma regulatory factor (Ser/Thr protein kinase)